MGWEGGAKRGRKRGVGQLSPARRRARSVPPRSPWGRRAGAPSADVTQRPLSAPIAAAAGV